MQVQEEDQRFTDKMNNRRIINASPAANQFIEYTEKFLAQLLSKLKEANGDKIAGLEKRIEELEADGNLKEKRIEELEQSSPGFYINTDMGVMHYTLPDKGGIIWEEITEAIEKIASPTGPGSIWLKNKLEEIVKEKKCAAAGSTDKD